MRAKPDTCNAMQLGLERAHIPHDGLLFIITIFYK